MTAQPNDYQFPDELPPVATKRQILAAVDAFAADTILAYLQRAKQEQDILNAHPIGNILTTDMPAGKKMRLCLEGRLSHQLIKDFRAGIEHDDIMSQWAVGSLRPLAQVAVAEDGENYGEYQRAAPSKALETLGRSLAGEIVEAYFIRYGEIAMRVEAVARAMNMSPYHVLQQMADNSLPDNYQAQINGDSTLSQDDLQQVLTILWTEETITITGKNTGSAKGETFQIYHETPPEIPATHPALQRFELLEYSMSSGYGTSLTFTGDFLGVLLEAHDTFAVPLATLRDADHIFKYFEDVLVRLTATNVNVVTAFKHFLLEVDTSSVERGKALQFQTILNFADAIPDLNLMQYWEDYHAVTIFEDSERQHITERLLEQYLQATIQVDEQGERSLQYHPESAYYQAHQIALNSSADGLARLESLLIMLLAQIDILRMSHLIFNSRLREVTGAAFTNSELCPQLQINVEMDDGTTIKGINFFLAIVAPVIKRILTLKQYL